MFSSKTDQWATPQAFFDELNREFNFTLDVAADATNHKCPAYYDKAVDGLKQPWVTSGGYSVTLRMAGKSASGSRRLMRKACMARPSLC